MINAPSGGAPEKAPRWDLLSIEGCGSGIRFSWCSWMFGGYVDIYRRKEYVGGATGGPRGWRARLVGVGAPPTSWPPLLCLDVGSKSPGSYSLRKSRSRRFHSVWTPFDIPFLRNPKTGRKQQFWAGPPVNRLVPKNNIKVENKAQYSPKQ